MSKEAIKILKKKMTLEERKDFVKVLNSWDNNWDEICNGYSISTLFISFLLMILDKKNEQKNWGKIFLRFTTKELYTIIKLNK